MKMDNNNKFMFYRCNFLICSLYTIFSKMITRILVVAVIAAIVAFTNADSSRFGCKYIH